MSLKGYQKKKSKIKNNKRQNINDLIKNPIKINTTKNYEKITKKYYII